MLHLILSHLLWIKFIFTLFLYEDTNRSQIFLKILCVSLTLSKGSSSVEKIKNSIKRFFWGLISSYAQFLTIVNLTNDAICKVNPRLSSIVTSESLILRLRNFLKIFANLFWEHFSRVFLLSLFHHLWKQNPNILKLIVFVQSGKLLKELKVMVSAFHPCFHKLSNHREVLLVFVSINRSKLRKVFFHIDHFKLVGSDSSKWRLKDIFKQTVNICLISKILIPLNPCTNFLPDCPWCVVLLRPPNLNINLLLSLNISPLLGSQNLSILNCFPCLLGWKRLFQILKLVLHASNIKS